jgi:diacylglycerol kinase (ATP)
MAAGIRARIGPVITCFTEGPGHATVLARKLADAGCELLIVAGGDGTLNEVANGILAGGSDARIALLPVGSGGDFARTLGLKKSAAMDALALGHWRRVDAFRARFRAADGRTAERCFVNAASFGLGAVSAYTARRYPRLIPARVRYLAATIPTLASGRSFRVRFNSGGAMPAAFDITTAAVCNGQFQGGGIHIAPEAVIDDGLADVTVVENVSLAEVLRRLPILYNGRLYSHPRVRHWRTAPISVDADSDTPLELDGEPVGWLPVEIETLPGALRIISPGPDEDHPADSPRHRGTSVRTGSDSLTTTPSGHL